MDDDIYGRTVTATDNGDGTTTYVVGDGQVTLTVATSQPVGTVYDTINAMAPG